MSTRLKKGIVLVGRHASMQILTQSVAFLSGILIVRTMDKDNYAGYAICISLISATAHIAEGGLNSTLMSLGGQIQKDRQAFSTLYASVMRFRLVIGLPVLLLGLIAIWFMLRGNNFSWEIAGIATALTSLAIWISLTSGTLYTVLRMDYKFQSIRRINFMAAVSRLALVALLAFGGVGTIETMLAIGLLVTLCTNRFLKYKIADSMPVGVPDLQKYKGAFKRAASQVMPMNLVLIASEQSVLVVLTILGTTSNIAEVQALARFGAVFVVFNSLLFDLAAPYVARMHGGPEVLRKGILPVLTAYLVLCVAIVFSGVVFDDFLLFLLGDQYAGLNTPLIVILSGIALNQFSSAFSVLNQARGWLRYSWTYIALMPVWLLVCLSVLDLTTTIGAAFLMATQPIPVLITQIVRCIAGCRISREASC